ncbi:MAG: hypothetical protein U0228_01425 [Myxococcaceae bacterium]
MANADGTSRCVLGNEASACGVNGDVCAVCAGNEACSAGGQCVADPSFDAGSTVPPPDGGTDACSDQAKLVYVLDQDRTLSSFNPMALTASVEPFTNLGKVSCPAMPGAEPFSMAVDRSATAWIVYDSGELFTVTLTDPALPCTLTTFVPQYGVARFGMGFVADSPGSSDETLFISGSELNGTLTATKFGTLGVVPPYKVSIRGTLPGAPEMSGTGDATLWAFFPNVLPPKVAQLDKTNGMPIAHFDAQALTGNPRAWAFAFWGGDFYLFLERDVDLSTQVWKMSGRDGTVTRVLQNTGRHLVGAGVSTCAPVSIN